MKILKKSALLAPTLALAMAGAALGADGDTAKDKATTDGNAVINFADLPHRIDSWQGDGTKGIYLKVGVNDWYHATFMAPCIDLPYVDAIGIGSGPTDRVDKFSAIVVGSGIGPQKCYFKAVDKVDGPPKKAKKSEKPEAAKG